MTNIDIDKDTLTMIQYRKIGGEVTQFSGFLLEAFESKKGERCLKIDCGIRREVRTLNLERGEILSFTQLG
jgi:hypothetical protein